MWEVDQVIQDITEGTIFEKLQKQAQEAVIKISHDELKQAVTALLCRPQPNPILHARILSNLVYADQYYEVFKTLELPHQLTVYEPCVGGSDPVIIATEAYSDGQANYLSMNLNHLLREELQAKISHLKSDIRIIDENAQKVLNHFMPNSVDVSCFHHAINDALQTAVSEPRGMDTTRIGWWSNERQMIEWMAEDFASGLIEKRGKRELMEIIKSAVELTRSGGYLVFDHWVSLFYHGLDWFPWKLFCDLVPITRQWIKESDLPVTEFQFPNVDPQWWMFLRIEK
jgi:hypothetical protein